MFRYFRAVQAVQTTAPGGFPYYFPIARAHPILESELGERRCQNLIRYWQEVKPEITGILQTIDTARELQT